MRGGTIFRAIGLALAGLPVRAGSDDGGGEDWTGTVVFEEEEKADVERDDEIEIEIEIHSEIVQDEVQGEDIVEEGGGGGETAVATPSRADLLRAAAPESVCALFPQLAFPCQSEEPDEVALWLRYYYKHRLAPRWAVRAVVSRMREQQLQRAGAGAGRKQDEEYPGLETMRGLFFCSGALWGLLEDAAAQPDGHARVEALVEAYRADEEALLPSHPDAASGPLATALWLCGSPACRAQLSSPELLGNPAYGSVTEVAISIRDIQLKFELLHGYFVATGDCRALQRLLDFLCATHPSQAAFFHQDNNNSNDVKNNTHVETNNPDGNNVNGHKNNVPDDNDDDAEATRLVLWMAHQEGLKLFRVYCLQHEFLRLFIRAELPVKPQFAGFPAGLVDEITSTVAEIDSRIKAMAHWREPTPVLPRVCQ
ncbi:MAG: hypothetical protein Q8P67_13675 [archaeon]|nr:hypothetical protein [archaeon]